MFKSYYSSFLRSNPYNVGAKSHFSYLTFRWRPSLCDRPKQLKHPSRLPKSHPGTPTGVNGTVEKKAGGLPPRRRACRAAARRCRVLCAAPPPRWRGACLRRAGAARAAAAVRRAVCCVPAHKHALQRTTPRNAAAPRVAVLACAAPPAHAAALAHKAERQAHAASTRRQRAA